MKVIERIITYSLVGFFVACTIFLSYDNLELRNANLKVKNWFDDNCSVINNKYQTKQYLVCYLGKTDIGE